MIVLNPKYTSQTYDIDTDLYYYNSRYYDPVLARFIQPDSIIPDIFTPQSINPYSYVMNNPLKYVDPTGHNPEDPYGDDSLMSDLGDPVADAFGDNGTAKPEQNYNSDESMCMAGPPKRESTPAADEGSGSSPSPENSESYHDRAKKEFTIDTDAAQRIAEEERSKRPFAHNDLEDAKRHAEWSRRTTVEVNEATAFVAGWGHEIDYFFKRGDMSASQYIEEARMDLHNNREGRRAGRSGREIDVDNLVSSQRRDKWPY